jgi:hypothetical protein
VYATCLFCNHHLGANQVLELFPVGRRLAFDAAKGRLWVVCRRCERWNLSPFDERWEAIEACERLFRDARKRVASDNVGLAKLDEGLELVRIGEPLRPEFAAWRYGDQFGRRRRQAVLVGVGIGAVAGGIMIGGAAVGIAGGGGWWIYQVIGETVKQYRRRRVVARVPTGDGRRLIVRGSHLNSAILTPDAQSTVGWNLHLTHATGVATLTDHHATRAAALIMPAVNRSGASKLNIQRAVREIESLRDPVEFLKTVAASPGQSGFYYGLYRKRPPKGLLHLPLSTRLAVEMAVNEEHERIALEGELALLELAWKDAEEIAAIADNLTIPAEVDQQLERLKREAGRDGKRGEE